MAAIQTPVDLGTGPDSGTGDTLYAGFEKLNNNMDLLAGAPDAAGSGASAIGYYDGTATNLQDFLDTFSYDGTNGVTTGANVGAGTGEIFKDKTTNFINFKTIVGGTNCTVSNGTDTVTIDAGLANSFTVTEITTGSTYITESDDEIILINTQNNPFTVTLQAGTDQRILYIKNLAWTGTAGSATATSAEVTIEADSGEYIEDDRSGLPATTTAIGPGSTMKIVFSTNFNCWNII